MPGDPGQPQLGYVRNLQHLEELGFGHGHSCVTPEMVLPSCFCEAHLIFSVLWASVQLCCYFRWGAGSFLFLSPEGFDQQQGHFVLGMTERKLNVSALEHLEISF